MGGGENTQLMGRFNPLIRIPEGRDGHFVLLPGRSHGRRKVRNSNRFTARSFPLLTHSAGEF